MAKELTVLGRVRAAAGLLLRGRVMNEMALEGGWWGSWGGPLAGNPDALRLPAVLCALRALSEGMGMLPLGLYEKKGRMRDEADGHPVHRLLHRAPNPWLTPFRLKEWLVNSAIVYGNFYAEVERNLLGDVVALWPLFSSCMQVRGTMGAPEYRYTVGGETVTLPPHNVFHLRGYYAGGLLGLSLMSEGAQALDTAAAADGYAARMFQQGMMPGGVIKHPGKLTKEAKSRMRESAEAAVQGLNSAHRLLVLDEGEEFQLIGINPKDAQALEVRQFSVLEVARIMNVTPHRLFDLSRTTYNNIEQSGIEFVQYSLGPWARRIEEELDRCLLSDAERDRYYTRFNLTALMRGDVKSRYEAYKIAREWGWMSANDVRALEEQNPVDGGDTYIVPLNQGDQAQVGEGEGDQEKKHADPHGQTRTDTDGQGREGRGAQEQEQEQEKRDVRAAKAKGRLALRDAWRSRLRSDAGRVVKGELRELKKIFGGERAHGPSFAGAASEGRHGQTRTDTDPHGQEEEKSKSKNLEVRAGKLAELVGAARKYYEGAAWREFVEKVFAPGLREFAKAMAAAAGPEAEEFGEVVGYGGVENFVEAVLEDIVLGRGLERLKTLERVMSRADEEGGDPAAAAEETLARWGDEGGDSWGDEAGTRLGEAVTVAVWMAMGVTLLKWRANASACKFCQGIDGKVVGIEKTFFSKGDTLGDGAGGSMSVSRRTGHPPVHGGCQCFVVPEAKS